MALPLAKHRAAPSYVGSLAQTRHSQLEMAPSVSTIFPTLPFPDTVSVQGLLASSTSQRLLSELVDMKIFDRLRDGASPATIFRLNSLPRTAAWTAALPFDFLNQTVTP